MTRFRSDATLRRVVRNAVLDALDSAERELVAEGASRRAVKLAAAEALAFLVNDVALGIAAPNVIDVAIEGWTYLPRNEAEQIRKQLKRQLAEQIHI